MKTYLSIDVATKSLAIGIYTIGKLDKTNIKDADYIRSQIHPHLMKVFDINDGQKVKDTTIISKSQSLKLVLNEIDTNLTPFETVNVLIEYQMNANHLSNAILNMIVYHYANTYPICIIKPTWKNTIAFREDLTLSTFLSKYSSNYSANKAHTRENMLHFLSSINKLDLIKDIKKKITMILPTPCVSV